ncbi:Pkinase-domain-containing protein [Melanogaster broomeanus]|nr:Pkinase-domain-containing protein [Melanogaster broomeanus]
MANNLKSNNGSDDQSSSPVASAASESDDRGRSRIRQPSNQLFEHYSMKKRGYHTFMSSFGKVFHVEKRWKLVRELGSGAYGVVVSAADEISGETVAIKLVTRVFEKVQLAKRVLREITLLRHFANHENITGLIDVDAISPDFQEMYIFMEPMEADLHQIIKSGQTLTNEHVQYFLYQILRGMKYIHSASVIHRDLKPGNLLVNSDCELKICDFGLSRGFDAAPDELGSGYLTEYVATRWYRAPEIMLAFRKYNTASCIFAELLLSRPLFKGKEMITFDPTSRISVLDALSHPYLASYHEEADEPECPTKFERWRDIEKLETLEEFREALWKEIEDYRMEVRGIKPEGMSLPRSLPRVVEEGQTPVSPSRSRIQSPKSTALDASLPSIEDDREGADTLVPPTTSSELPCSVTPTDPVVTYARRCSILQPARQSSTSVYNSPVASTVYYPLPTVSDGLPTTGGQGIPFPSETYVVPARSRAASTTGGDAALHKLLRTLSTVSIHESVEGMPGGFAGVAHVGKFIVGQESGADAPPSEMPMEFADKGGQDGDGNDGQR